MSTVSRHALVTGGGQGIGAAIAQALAEGMLLLTADAHARFGAKAGHDEVGGRADQRGHATENGAEGQRHEHLPGREIKPLRHLNGHRTAHGGVVHLLADCAAGFAANSTGEQAVTQTNTITFLTPSHAGETLTAIGTFVARSGRSALYDVVVTAEDGRQVAVMRAQMRHIAPKA